MIMRRTVLLILGLLMTAATTLQAQEATPYSQMEKLGRGVVAIRANAFAPGFIETAMTAALPEDVREQWKQKIPLRRGGQVEDIANVATFLASDMSSYVSGQVIQVDGGMNM